MGYPPLPQNNVVDGMTGHDSDHDDIYAGLAALEAAVPYPPGGTTDFLRADGSWAPAGAVLDSTAADFVPDSVQSAGSSALGARADHSHPEKAWQTAYTLPSGGLAETFPRLLATNNQAQSSTTTKCQLITLPKGLLVSNIHLITGTTAESGGTHGWVALLDTSFTVLAVSADQTGNTWGSANTDTPVAVGTPYLVPSSGAYYIAESITATGMPSFACGPGPTLTTAWAVPPVISCTRGVQSTPPPVSGVLGTASTVNSTDALYAYIS